MEYSTPEVIDDNVATPGPMDLAPMLWKRLEEKKVERTLAQVRGCMFLVIGYEIGCLLRRWHAVPANAKIDIF